MIVNIEHLDPNRFFTFLTSLKVKQLHVKSKIYRRNKIHIKFINSICSCLKRKNTIKSLVPDILMNALTETESELSVTIILIIEDKDLVYSETCRWCIVICCQASFVLHIET